MDETTTTIPNITNNESISNLTCSVATHTSQCMSIRKLHVDTKPYTVTTGRIVRFSNHIQSSVTLMVLWVTSSAYRRLAFRAIARSKDKAVTEHQLILCMNPTVTDLKFHIKLVWMPNMNITTWKSTSTNAPTASLKIKLIDMFFG